MTTLSDLKKHQFAVLGLGRFGMSLLETLCESDVSVLACDKNHARIQEAAAFATQVVETDISNEANLEALGIGNFDVVVVAIGDDFEAALMATAIAKEKGARFVLAKASTQRQKRILEGVGADRVILPEREMAEKVARGLIGTNVMDILEDAAHYTITEMCPLEYWVGKTVSESDIRAQHGMNILAVRRGDDVIIPVRPDEVLAHDDVLIILSSPHVH